MIGMTHQQKVKEGQLVRKRETEKRGWQRNINQKLEKNEGPAILVLENFFLIVKVKCKKIGIKEIGLNGENNMIAKEDGKNNRGLTL